MDSKVFLSKIREIIREEIEYALNKKGNVKKEQTEMVRLFFKNFMPDAKYTIIIDDMRSDEQLIVTTLKDNWELMRLFQNQYLNIKSKFKKQS